MKKLSAKDEQDIYNKYTLDKLTAADLAAEYEITRQVVNNAIERHSIFMLVGEEDQMTDRLFRRKMAYEKSVKKD